ncbi:MAG: hypothetical protein MJA31_04560 [Clostridia bacterium]|nr:hypothetical protein [Clostridia bacterium]
MMGKRKNNQSEGKQKMIAALLGMTIRNWGKVYGEPSIMYEGRLSKTKNTLINCGILDMP